MTKQFITGAWFHILYLLLFFACCLPAIDGFSDNLIVPKWYATAFVVSIIVISHCFLGNALNRNTTSTAIFTMLIVGFSECVFVLINEVLCSGIKPSVITGTFDNPAGLALYVCLCLPFTVMLILGGKKWWQRTAGLLLTASFIAILSISKSRTGLISAGIIIAMALLSSKSRIFKNTTAKIALTIGIFIAIGVYVTTQKHDSTSGRRFILERTWELICEAPFTGHGEGGFNREYMKRQADFFMKNPDSKYAMLADEVRHPLNEFAKAWVEYGALTPLLLLALIVVPIIMLWKKKRLHYRAMSMAMTTILVFSCFSYPFNYPVTWVIMIMGYVQLFSQLIAADRVFMRKQLIKSVFLLASILVLTVLFKMYSNERKWYLASQYALHGDFAEAEPLYKQLKAHYANNPYFLYNYTAELYHAGLFDDAVKTAKECREYWSGYNLELLTGDIYRKLNQYDNAIQSYQMASNMCPSRFAPLEGLYYTYLNKGDTTNARNISNIISTKKMKVISVDALRIKKETQYRN